jgi:hypothetical protein
MSAAPARIAADDFWAIARQMRAPLPDPVRAADDEWQGFCRAVWSAFPAWGYDRAFLAELAAQQLPRILAQMGVSRLIGRIDPQARHIVGKGAPLATLPLCPDGRWMLLRLEQPAPALLALDGWSHAWRCPVLSGRGNDLIDLGAWRWATTPAKAAFRIARLCGRRRPVP